MRYLDIYEDLLAKLDDGTYPAGSVLPTEHELAQGYDVSRPTVRHALKLLAEAGRIDRRKRRGTVVCEPKIEQGFATVIRSFDDEMRAAGHIPRTTVISCTVRPASAQVAQSLDMPAGSAVLHLVRVRYASDLPNVLVETFVPHVRYPGLETTDFERHSLYATMRTMGNPVVRAHRRIEVALCDRGLSPVLGIAPGAPVFVFHTTAFDSEDVPAEYSIATYRGDTNSFELETQLVR
ncbi:MAG: GntR family transcriptional regulator [Acidobacteriota bacterium]|jgi:GntR family transcriptional regulator|nr:GntR family transcriptional regulator [Acidobacteriota bacterium]